MDDDTLNSGLGGYAWFELGRQAAKSSQMQEELFADLTGTAPVSRREYNRVVQLTQQWQAECQQLQAANNQLVGQLRAANKDYAKLKAWADDCSRRRDEWKERYEDQKNLTFAVSSRVNDLLDELQRLEETGG